MAGGVTDIFTNMAAAFTPFYDSFKQRFMPNATINKPKEDELNGLIDQMTKLTIDKAKKPAFIVNHEEPIDERELFHERCKIRDKCLGHPKIAEQLGGLLAKVVQRNAYSDEALLGEIIAMYVEFTLSPAIQLFDLQIKKAHMGQHETEKLSIIYRKGKDGKFPPIYQLDENGELDLKNRVENPDELLIWKNGYFPDPEISDPRTFIRILSMGLADFTGKVLGTQTLDELNRARLGLQDQHSSGHKAPAPPAVTNPTPPPSTPKP